MNGRKQQQPPQKQQQHKKKKQETLRSRQRQQENVCANYVNALLFRIISSHSIPDRLEWKSAEENTTTRPEAPATPPIKQWKKILPHGVKMEPNE